MKIPKENISAFSVYAKQLKQKKKPKVPLVNGVSKVKKRPGKTNELKVLQAKKLSDNLQALVTQTRNIGKQISNARVSVNSHENIPVVLSKNKRKIKNIQEGNHDNGESSVKRTNRSKQKKIIHPNPKETNHQIEVKWSNEKKDNRDTSVILKSSIKSKKKLDPKISTLLIKEKQTSLKQKKNKVQLTNLSKQNKTKHSKLDNQRVESENVIRNKIPKDKRIKEKPKLKKKDVSQKLVEKKEDKLGNNNWATQENSSLGAKLVFESIINPVSEKDFMRSYWEKQLLLVQRKDYRDYFTELISTLEIDSMLRKNNIQFTKHLDITSYTEQGRETHNLSGRAQANVVWDFYSNGCSVRLLNPQAFLPKIHTLNAALQGYFGCFVGANVYLTPPNSQGFAPHYDDIEAFVLQIEGKKRWKVYNPRSEGDMLPRLSSPNFSQEEIGEPILDVTLEPGDMLYFPRGFIHQASTVEGEHSLHITLSAYQKTAWVDLMEKAIPIALERAAAVDVEFRRGLPRDYLGIEFHGDEEAKVSFTSTAHWLMAKVADLLPYSLGAAVDRMGAQFMHDALPPVFTPEEKKNSSLGGGLKMTENGKLVDRLDLEMETEVKLVRANICRLVDEEEELRLYHCLDNSLEYHGQDPQFLVLPPEGGEIVTLLCDHYPAYTKIEAFPHKDKNALLTLMSDLWDAGLLLVRGA